MIASCSFFTALWTQYCSSAHSLHSASTWNKKPTWNPEAWRRKKKKVGQQPWVHPTDGDGPIREAHPTMALLPFGQSQQIRGCRQCRFIRPPHICPRSNATGEEIKTAIDLLLCTEISPLQLSNNTCEKNQGETRHYYQDSTDKSVKLNYSLSVVKVFLPVCTRCLLQWKEN